jgi:hypothetical protein
MYGVDLSQKITSEKVRNALVTCFTEAQNDMMKCMKTSAPSISDEIIKKLSVDLIIKTSFEKAGVDFENPTKDGLKKVIEELITYARKVFRDEEIIQKHAKEINMLIEKIKE